MFNNTLPSVFSVLLGIAEAALALALGLYVFYKNQDEFILNL